MEKTKQANHQAQVQHRVQGQPFYQPPVYQPHRANPFIPSGGSTLYQGNELLLKDPELRQRSGVAQLDQGVTDGYAANTVRKSNL